MSPVSRYGRVYARGSYYDRVRTIIAVVLIALYLLAKFAIPGLAGLFIGMNVPLLFVAFMLFLAWPEGAMQDKRIAVGLMVVFLLLLFFHIL
ncbi:MAG TPA: hypothetical protein VOB72_13215 [Candidatus Dormibacteraeota bacterium]|nr:hypothetical protein [Candidatus Dormibacteraeota bacterium]